MDQRNIDDTKILAFFFAIFEESFRICYRTVIGVAAVVTSSIVVVIAIVISSSIIIRIPVVTISVAGIRNCSFFGQAINKSQGCLQRCVARMGCHRSTRSIRSRSGGGHGCYC